MPAPGHHRAGRQGLIGDAGPPRVGKGRAKGERQGRRPERARRKEIKLNQ